MSEKQHETCMVQSDKYIIERGHKTAGWGNQFDVYLGASRRGFASTVLSRERDDDNTTRPKHYYAITNQLLTYAVGGRAGGSVGRAALKSLSYLQYLIGVS